MDEGVTVEEAVRRRVNQFHKDLDEVCEAAVQNGQSGVRVEWSEGLGYEISVDPDVPFGQIVEVIPL